MRTILLLIWFSLHYSKPYQIVYPRKVPLLRSTRSALGNELQHVNIDTGQQSDSFSLYLKKNKQLLTSSAVIEWHYPNGTKQELNLLEVSLEYFLVLLLSFENIGFRNQPRTMMSAFWLEESLVKIIVWQHWMFAMDTKVTFK